MIFADKVLFLFSLFFKKFKKIDKKRYTKSDKKDKLPNWIKNYFEDHNLNLSTDIVTKCARDYFK